TSPDRRREAASLAVVRPGLELPLAARAVPGAAAGDPRLLDRMSAASAGLAFAAVDPELRLHRAFGALGGSVVAQRRSLARDAQAERAADRLDEGVELFPAHVMAGTKRMEPGPPERLVRVDVSDARENPLV